MELFLFPVPAGGGFGSAPKLHVIYRGGAATAEVSDLEHPTAKPVTVTVIHDGTTISLTFDNALTGVHLQGFFLRIEKGPGRVDLTRSRTVWIGIASVLP
jgi:hypothetical protein